MESINVGDRVSFDFKARNGRRWSGIGKVTGTAHVKFHMYNVVIDGDALCRSITIAARDLHTVNKS